MGAWGNRSHFNLKLAAALLAAALGAACAQPVKEKRFLLHPNPPEDAAYSLSAGALLYKDANAEVELRPLDQEFVAGILDGKGLADPFNLPVKGLAPLVFELRIKCLGAKSVYFNPQAPRGTDETQRRYYPMSYTDFYQIFREEPDGEARLKAFNSVCYDAPEHLQKGQETKKYLPLTSHTPPPKELTVTIPLMLGGKEGFIPVFAFEGFPGGEEGAEEK